VMDQVYEILIHKVHEFGGTVNEMTGDGVLALFGAPISIEDSPQRAIRVAMAIHREMAKFNETLKKEKSGLPALKMRIGIHTGPVVVGSLGNDLRVEFKAVGDTVNLASRIENMAEPGATYVTGDTFCLTEGLFRFESQGEKSVKGKKDPVRVYRVIATSSRRTRFDVSAERGLTPFVGRDRELELLLDGFERARDGRGQAFSIMAEAGVGKSRLLYEFRKAVSNEDITFLEGKCLSYSRGVAYQPVIDILKSNFNILDTDDCDEIREKVTKWLKAVGVNEAATLPYLLELLSVKESGIDRIDTSPEAIKDRIISTVNLITLKGAEIRPLVLAVEDLHWIDKNSEEFFKILLEGISGASVFLIFTYRPEYVLTWGGKSYHSQINLNRLSNRETLAMLSHLLGNAEVDKDIEELVLEKTEGVPFFIEEFIRTLKDLKMIEAAQKQYHLVKNVQDVAIPSTIQEVIMSRVDSLPDGAKDLLQIGSVIGREFNYVLVQKVAELQERELLSRLAVLKDTELIYERGIYPDASYIFKHALTQEVVYDSILGKRKKRLHERIGKVIEELDKHHIDEQYEVLTEHFVKAENFEKAEAFCKRVCKKAAKKALLGDAISYGKTRLNCLERMQLTDDVQKRIIDSRIELGFYFLQMYSFKEAKDAVAPVVEMVLQNGSKRQLSRIRMIEGTYYMFIIEDLPEACKHLEEAIEISREQNDVVTLVWAQAELGNLMGINCDFDKAASDFESVLEIAENAKSKWGIALPKSSQSYSIYGLQGKIDLAYQTSREAIQLAEESGDILSKAQSLSCHGVACYQKGLLKDAEKYLIEGFNACEHINLFMWGGVAQHTLGEIYYETGDYQQSKNCYLHSIAMAEKGQMMPSWIKVNKIAAARSMMMTDERTVDLNTLYKQVSQNKWPILDGSMRRLVGDILLNMDSNYIEESEKWIREAIEADQKNGAMFLLAKDYALYAKYFRRIGERQKAREHLNRAIQIFKECGADGWVEKYEKQFGNK